MDANLLAAFSLAALAGLGLLTLMWKAQANTLQQVLSWNLQQQKQLDACATEHKTCRQEVSELRELIKGNTTSIKAIEKKANGDC